MKPRDALAMLVLPAAVLGLWWLLSRSGWLSPAFLPTPQATAASLAQGLGGELARAAQATTTHMLQGWLLASAAGIALGAAISLSPAWVPWLDTTLEFLRPLPAAAVMPLTTALLGPSLGAVLWVVAFSAFWPTLLATVHGIRAVEPGLLEVARCLQLSRMAFLGKIALPHAAPDILAGLRLALTSSLIVCILAEMLTTQDGLGQSILLAARAYRASELFATLALISLIGLGGQALLSLVEQRLLRHRGTERG